MKSRYLDIAAINQVIGCVYKNPKLFAKEDKYKFSEEDFPNSVHKIIFGAIYNLWQLGSKSITLESIEDYLSSRPKLAAEYKVNNGAEYLLKVAEAASELTFDYYYARVKKMSLLRAYNNVGMSLTWLYDPDELDSKKKQEQEDYIDAHSLEDIADEINNRIEDIKLKYVGATSDGGNQIADGIDDLLASLKETPSLGYPLYGKYMNTVTRGARLGKFFLRSAATGVGKTRSMIADACYIGCSQMYDLSTNKWVSIGVPQNVLYIATEQDLTECQTMCIAFIAGVDEEHILRAEYYVGEEERVNKAAMLLKQSAIQFECLPDFTMSLIENVIKKHIREDKTQYIFMDYIHSSASILMEVGGHGGVKNLREDNVLFLLSSSLKDIAVKNDVFILSSTQLNASYMDSEILDQNCLRGSKAIADRIDIGMLLVETTKEDKEKLKPFCTKSGIPIPNVKLSIYKNRQGRYKGMYLWMSADRSMCRFDPLFATDWNYSIMELEDLKIRVEEAGAF